jgi:hypothetical protein
MHPRTSFREPAPPSESASVGAEALRAALEAARTQDGESLLSLSRSAPVLVIFLRHFG